MVGAAAALAQLPAVLGAKGWLDDAVAQSSDLVTDTFNGLAAFMLPGDDPYSVAQGETGSGPGGVASGGVAALIDNLDDYVPLAALGPNASLPASGGVAQLLNGYALQVNPAAAGGAFVSPFARLKFDEKIEVFRRFEGDTEGTELRFVSGILIGAVGFLSYTEGNALDRNTRRLTRTPTGWTLSKYDGVAEGRPEMKGYWRGRRKVRTSRQYQVKR
jgi:hypothetical protein